MKENIGLIKSRRVIIHCMLLHSLYLPRFLHYTARTRATILYFLPFGFPCLRKKLSQYVEGALERCWEMDREKERKIVGERMKPKFIGQCQRLLLRPLFIVFFNLVGFPFFPLSFSSSFLFFLSNLFSFHALVTITISSLMFTALSFFLTGG